jgi:hypothetical protein
VHKTLTLDILSSQMRTLTKTMLGIEVEKSVQPHPRTETMITGATPWSKTATCGPKKDWDTFSDYARSFLRL